MLSRRDLLAGAAAAAAVRPAGARRLEGVKIGVTDWNLQLTAKPEALALAKRVGFEGVEVSLGNTPVEGKLRLADPALQDTYVAEARRLGIALAGTCLDILHRNYLKSDELGRKWVAEAIPITRRLGASIILLPFFGKGGLDTEAEREYVGDILRELAPQALREGITLGLENTCSAEENARIMDRSRSEAVKVYYDTGNSAGRGYDIYSEMPWLGAGRICQIHLKDNPHYLGEGKIDFARVFAIIANLGFRGFANLETNAPSKSVEDDMRRNLAYVRKLVQAAG